jgi:hypothetical protein
MERWKNTDPAKVITEYFGGNYATHLVCHEREKEEVVPEKGNFLILI